MNEYEQVNGLWLPKYVQRNGVWVKREDAQPEPTVSAYDALRVIELAKRYWFYGATVRGYLPYQATEEENAVAEAEAILSRENPW